MTEAGEVLETPEIVDYIILEYDNYTKLAYRVRQRLEDGWELYGNLIVTLRPHTTTTGRMFAHYTREMVKYE